MIKLLKTKASMLLALSAVLLIAPTEAQAATVGDALTNLVTSIASTPLLVSSFSYIAGLVMMLWSVFTFRDVVDGGAGAPNVSTAVKRMLAGSMFLSLPTVVEASVQSWVGTGGTNMTFTGTVAPTGTGAGTLDEMATAFISNMAGPFSLVLSAFAYLGGLILIVIAISRLTRSYQEGWRGPTGIGTVMTMLCGGALISSGEMMGAFSTSIFGDATSFTNPVLSGVIADAMDADAQAKVEATISALLAFIVIVGWIAFIRGWFVLKAVADGNSQVSMAQALTFLFGGALAVNIGEVVNLIQNTVGGTVLGISFT